jgi:hypothetical protein
MSERIVAKVNNTVVVCLDEPGQGGACHEYRSFPKEGNENELQKSLLNVSFQNGPIKENGINGCQNEDLLAIVIDRLQGFQSGQFKCRENALALTKCEEALMWLRKRTQDRIDRGVEGTNIK